MAGAENLRLVLWLHGISAYAILALLRWKGAVMLQSVTRRRRAVAPRIAFLVLAGLLGATLATGLSWVFLGRFVLAGYSFMTIHALLAAILFLLLAWHVVALRFIFVVRRARDRRALLRLGMLGVAGLALWQAAGWATTTLTLPGDRRRFTGSYALPSFTGQLPTVSWLFDAPPPVDPAVWQLTVDGAVERPLTLAYPQLRDLAIDQLTATLDCTGGWYSAQEWHGVLVGHLLGLVQPEATAQTVIVESVTGYRRRYALAEARQLLLATHLGGDLLNHGHGFPARLVAPGHRGYDWVKWVARISVVESPWFWQPPLPP
jgi:DMSO/TMAO reductase YedYZ molybdopterin-dependent catalytic subunit